MMIAETKTMERKTRKSQQLKGRIPERTESGLRPKTAFVIMPFNPGLGPVYSKIIQPILHNAGYVCNRGDDKSDSIAIIDKVFKMIEQTDLIVCDLTDNNPNVYYELGYAHARKKQTILLSQTIPSGQLPFDIRHRTITFYTDDKFSLLQLREDLANVVNTISPLVDRPTTRRSYPSVAADEIEAARSSLFHYSNDARRYAVRFLGECADKESYGRIKTMIETAYGNVDLTRDGLTALYKIASKAARQDLDSYLGVHNPNDLVRERAVALLGNYPPTKDMVESMLSKMHDHSWGVRVAVCQALGQWGGRIKVPPVRTVIETLKGIRKSDSEFPVRVAAEDALNKLYSSHEDLAVTADDTAPIILEDELVTNS
jgi:HEAT repeat protein